MIQFYNFITNAGKKIRPNCQKILANLVIFTLRPFFGDAPDARFGNLCSKSFYKKIFLV